MPNQVPAPTPVSQASSSSRKRSRSASESDTLQPSKRQNTGLASPGSATALDVPMSEAQENHPPATTHASTSTASTDIEKPKDLPAKPEPGIDKDGHDAASSGTASGATVATIHMRCLIVTQDASIIIGKAGAHVNEIREKSGAKVMVSESIPGNPERILNVSGALDAVSKVCRTCLPPRILSRPEDHF